jgi:hypothetical protein
MSADLIIRRALSEDVRPALDLALRVFTEYEMPDYPPEALGNFRRYEIENEMFIKAYGSGRHEMFVALDGKKIVGMIAEREGHIAMLWVPATLRIFVYRNKFLDYFCQGYFRVFSYNKRKSTTARGIFPHRRAFTITVLHR